MNSENRGEWEVPASAALAFCRAFWRGQTRRLALGYDGRHCFFWEPDSAQFQSAPAQWTWSIEGEFWGADADGAWMEDELEHALALGSVGRRLALSGQLSVFVPEKGPCRVRFRAPDGEEIFASAYGGWGGDELFSRPAAHWLARLDDAAAHYDPWEGVGSAIAKTPYASGERARVTTQRETTAELERIADLIFLLDIPWIEWVMNRPRNEGTVWISVYLHLDRPTRFAGGGADKDGSRFSVEHPRAALWQVLLDYFGPRPDLEFHRAEIEAGRRLFPWALGPQTYWNKYFDEERSYHGRPVEWSQHEWLELRLEIRDWLRQRAGQDDQTIARLLR